MFCSILFITFQSVFYTSWVLASYGSPGIFATNETHRYHQNYAKSLNIRAIPKPLESSHQGYQYLGCNKLSFVILQLSSRLTNRKSGDAYDIFNFALNYTWFDDAMSV
jgi:hypothetical protein